MLISSIVHSYCFSLHKNYLFNIISFSLAVTFTTPPKTTDDGKSLFAKYPQKPDKLPIRYFPQLRPENFHPVTFSNIHGPELELYCEYKVALRKRMFYN
jgi:hypothetical protein